jgi:hypothetical protein
MCSSSAFVSSFSEIHCPQHIKAITAAQHIKAITAAYPEKQNKNFPSFLSTNVAFKPETEEMYWRNSCRDCGR